MAETESILLTGATGNVGAVILETLFRTTPHSVNIVLRDAAKQIPLFESRFPEETSSSRLTFTPISDMTVPGVFDTAASTATSIIHCATPIAGNGDWVKNMIETTWNIDHNILLAAKKSPRVTRVIICGTLLQAINYGTLFDPNTTITPSSYNSIPFDKAKDGPWSNAYMYSKTNAEHKTWAWLRENASSINFDIIMTLPPMITGRSPQVGYKPNGGSPGGVGRIYTALLETKKAEDMDAIFPFFMDTDDVARVHIQALDRVRIKGNARYLLASHEIVNLRAVAKRLREEDPRLAEVLPDVELDVEGFEKRKARLARLDLSESDALFGVTWKSAYESIKEIVLDDLRWNEENKHEKASM